MERKNVIIIGITIIVILAIIAGTAYLTSVKETTISLKEKTVTQGDVLTFSLYDTDGNPLANKTLNVSITTSKNKTKSYNLTTNSKGVAKLKVKFKKGKYTVNAVFDGELLLKSSNITKKIKVKEKEKPAPKVSSAAPSKTIVDENYCESGHDIVYSNGETESWDAYTGTYVHSYPNGKSYVRDGATGKEGYYDTDKLMS